MVRLRPALQRDALRSVAALFGGNLISSMLGVLGGLLAARFLGPEDTGLFRSYGIPLTYLAPLHLGTFDGLWRQLPYYSGKGMPDRADSLSSSAGAWNVGVSGIVCVGFVSAALAALTRGDLRGFAGWSSQAICAWGVFYGGYLGTTYRTIRHFSLLARNQLIQAIVNFAAVFLVPVLGFFGLCLRSAVPAAAGVVLMHRGRPYRGRYAVARGDLVEVIKVGLPFSAWGGLNTSIWQATEAALALKFAGPTGLGLFAVASVMRDAMNVLPAAVQQVLMPSVVERYAREGSVRGVTVWSVIPTLVTTGITAALAVIAALLLGVAVPWGLPKYAAGVPLMRVCLWFAVISAASLPLNTLFATGRAWSVGRGIILGWIVFPATTVLLAPVLGGVIAVAVGSLAGRTARTLAAYAEIAVLSHGESSARRSLNGSASME